MKQVEITYINLLINKYEKRETFTYEQLNNFYTIDKGKFIACANAYGNCFIEEFDTFIGCKLYLDSNCNLSECQQIDEQLYQLQLKAESNPVLTSRNLDKLLTDNRLLKEENKRLKEELRGFTQDIKRVAGAIIHDSNILLNNLKKREEQNPADENL